MITTELLVESFLKVLPEAAKEHKQTQAELLADPDMPSQAVRLLRGQFPKATLEQCREAFEQVKRGVLGRTPSAPAEAKVLGRGVLARQVAKKLFHNNPLGPSSRTRFEEYRVSLHKHSELVAQFKVEADSLRARHQAELEAELTPLRDDIECSNEQLHDESHDIYSDEIACEERVDEATGLVGVWRLDTKPPTFVELRFEPPNVGQLARELAERLGEKVDVIEKALVALVDLRPEPSEVFKTYKKWEWDKSGGYKDVKAPQLETPRLPRQLEEPDLPDAPSEAPMAPDACAGLSAKLKATELYLSPVQVAELADVTHPQVMQFFAGARIDAAVQERIQAALAHEEVERTKLDVGELDEDDDEIESVEPEPEVELDEQTEEPTGNPVGSSSTNSLCGCGKSAGEMGFSARSIADIVGTSISTVVHYFAGSVSDSMREKIDQVIATRRDEIGARPKFGREASPLATPSAGSYFGSGKPSDFGLSGKAIANLSGIHRTQVSRYFEGKSSSAATARTIDHVIATRGDEVKAMSKEDVLAKAMAARSEKLLATKEARLKAELAEIEERRALLKR